MPRSLALLCVLVIGAACASQSPATAKTSHASSAPSDAPSSPSPTPELLQITAASFHVGETGFRYAPARPTATGGVPPYTWSMVAGTLPPGLAIDPSGTISGTPGTQGTFIFTIQVADGTGHTATIDTTINVTQHLALSPTCPTNSPCMVEAGCVTVCGGYANLTGGVPPYTYRLVSGAIPTGMALNGTSLARTFPAPSGSSANWTFTVKLTDGLGAGAQVTASFHVFAHIAFVQPIPACTGTTVRAGCTAILKYTGGTPGLPSPPFITNPAQVPPGTVTASNGTVTVNYPSTCTAPGTPYTTKLTIVLIDASVCGTGQPYCSSPPVTVNVKLLC